MSLRQCTPCDYGECPYSAQYFGDCEYWCGAESEPEEEEYYDNDNEEE